MAENHLIDPLAIVHAWTSRLSDDDSNNNEQLEKLI